MLTIRPAWRGRDGYARALYEHADKYRGDVSRPGVVLLTDVSGGDRSTTGRPFVVDPFTRAFIAHQKAILNQ